VIGYKRSVDPPTDTYTRRICAVLLADVSGFSALMGEDDERTARDVERLHALMGAIVADAGGRAEPVAGDALFATFDNVVAAVGAALRIHDRIAGEDFAGRRLAVRIGVHFGDLLLRGTVAFGDAINVAARLQTLALPGTVCISDGVYRHVQTRFDVRIEDLGRQKLKNISSDVHAYLMVPHGTAGAGRSRWQRSLVVGAGALAATLLVTGIVLRYVRMPSRGAPEKPAVVAGETAPVAAPAEKNEAALGVMVFRMLGDDGDHAWMREALRDGLNTQLSELSGVKVYSKEFLDFLITRQGLSEVEAATKLGVRKMVSGSFVVAKGQLRIETHVVDVGTGVLMASVNVAGRTDDLIDLQKQTVVELVSRLDLPITPEEHRALLARRTDENVEALKLLLDAEGGGKAPPPPVPPPSSAIPRWLADVLGPAVAHAEAAADKSAILEVLEKYRRATEAREMTAVASIYTEFSPEQQAAQQRYFDNVKDLKIAIENVDVAVVGDEAVVSYTRTDDFADTRTGRPMHVSVRLTKVMKRATDGWKIAGGK